MSFLAVLAISHSKLYKKKIKLLLMGYEIRVREGSYAFLLFQSVRTSKIGDEHIVFNDGENMLCLGKCVLSSTSLSVSEMKTFFSQMQVFFLY